MASRGFWRELKRRHVYRVAAAYAIVGWLLIQVVTQVFPIFHLPDWIDQAIVLLILVGFPIALVLAWAFDATPHGIVMTDAQDAKANPRAWRRSRRAGIAIGAMGVLIALVAGGAYWHFGRPASSPVVVARVARSHNAAVCRSGRCPRPGAEMQDQSPAPLAPTQVASAQAIPAKSVAILPLVNESGDKGQQYFSDGISEDLINALSQFSGLKVINRDSSFQFRNSKDSVQEIGEKLGVAHLLEGSVQRAGDEVRVSAELVSVFDGSTLWSQQYDRPYKDLFALQDDITKSVADALKAKLLDSSNGAVPQSDRPPSGDLAAYNAYLKGQAYYLRLASEPEVREAIAQFAEAARLDPNYAAAYAATAQAWIHLAAFYLGGGEQRQAYADARIAADKALQLNPDLAAAHVARGLLQQWADFDWSGAEAEYRRALQLSPNDGQAKFGLAYQLSNGGHARQAIALLQQVLTTDPSYSEVSYMLAWNLAAVGDLEEAERVQQKSIELRPGVMNSYAGLAIIQVLRGEAVVALATARHEPNPMNRDFALALAWQAAGNHAAADATLQTMIGRDAEIEAYQIAEVYAFRRDPDNVFKWLDRAWANRDPGISLLLTDPFILRYRDDPRFSAFCKKVGLPTTTDAKALP